MPNKLQEEFCIKEFADFLTRQRPNRCIRWQPVSNDPPDFWIWIDGERHAAEVTTVRDELSHTHTISLWEVVATAERAAIHQGILRGRYIVDFHASLDHARQKSKLRKQIVDYVTQTGSVVASQPKVIFIGNRMIARISKYADEGSAIYPSGGPGDEGGFEGDIERELTELLEKVIAMKVKKMERVRGAKILILYDLYGLAYRRIFQRCLAQVPGISEFTQIYVVNGISEGYCCMPQEKAH